MVPTSRLPDIDRSVMLSSLGAFSDKLRVLTDELRDQILAPRPRKNAPVFTTSQVAELCGIDRSRLNYLATKEGSDLPPGVLQGNGRSRVFTLEETIKWVQQVAPVDASPLLSGLPANGRTLAVAQLKGGSCKTTTAMCLAQALSLLGRKILVIDLDPQGSLTELCGLYAEKEVTDDDTILPAIQSPNEADLRSAAQTCYWHNIDIIPANPNLFGAEFHIPAMVNTNSSFQFWALLDNAIKPLKSEYDYIILDTSPSLSYLTINALMAADALVMPLVPESLDFVSSVSFWNLFADLSEFIVDRMPTDRKYDFISVLLTKVDNNPNSSASVVRAWAQRAYGDWLSTIEIPASTVMSNSALAISTVFDLSKADAGAKALSRIREPLEQYAKWLDDLYVEQRKAA